MAGNGECEARPVRKTTLARGDARDLDGRHVLTMTPFAAHVLAAPETSVNVPPSSFIIRVSAPGLDWTRQEDGSSVASVHVLGVSLNFKGKIVDHIYHPMIAIAKPGTNLRDESRTADCDRKTS